MSLRLAQNGHAKHIILRNPCLKKRSETFSLETPNCAHAVDSSVCVSRAAILFTEIVVLLFLGTIQDKMRKQDSDWEKYLISCYTQSMK